MLVALITDYDDRTLVELHRAGDEDAFRRIVQRHHRSLYANAMRRLGDPVLAEDAVQDAFLRAFRNLDRFDGDYHLDAWLHRIVTNTCHDIGRRRGRDVRLFDRACTEVEVEAPAADDELETMPRDQLHDALDALPESYREVLLLRFVDEMSYPDVAIKAGITEENARARVSRGRNMLKRMLSSTSALVVWAIAPLRRGQGTLTGAEADTASQAASQVQTLTGITNVVSAAPSAHASGISQLTGLVAQAAPSIAQAAPAVTSSAPTLGKAAVAVGLAAAAAIPAGVAVERARDKPVPVTAPAADEEDASTDAGDPVEIAAPTTAADSSTTETSTIEALGSGTPDIVAGGIDSTSSTAVDSAPSTTVTTVQPSEPTPTTAPPAPSDGGTSPTAPPAEEEPPAEEPPPPPSGELSADLTVDPSGARLHLSGPITLDIGGQTRTGTFEGKLMVDEAAPKDPEGPREVQLSTFQLVFDDGTTLELSISGQAFVYTQGQETIYDLVVRYRLAGGSALALAETGELQSRLVTNRDDGGLTMTLPGAPSDEGSGS